MKKLDGFDVMAALGMALFGGGLYLISTAALLIGVGAALMIFAGLGAWRKGGGR